MKPLIIATSRQWNEYLAKEIATATARKTYLITNKQALNIDYLTSIEPEYIFFPHWSYIIPSEIFENFECIIFHMTDLPFGRGGSPLQNLILQGIEDTKLSALKCVEELDAGPVYLKKKLNLNGSANEIYLRASKLTQKMILEILDNRIIPEPQTGKPVEFPRRQPGQSNIQTADINSLQNIFDFIRMLDAEGYPKAYLEAQGYTFEFKRVHLENDELKGTFTVHKKNTLSEPSPEHHNKRVEP